MTINGLSSSSAAASQLPMERESLLKSALHKMCCRYNRERQEAQAESTLLRLNIKHLSEDNRQLKDTLNHTRKDNVNLVAQAALASEKERIARKEAADQIAQREKIEALDTLLTKLDQENKLGKPFAPPPPGGSLVAPFGYVSAVFAIATLPLSWPATIGAATICFVGGHLYAMRTNPEPYFNRSDKTELLELQKKAQGMCTELHKDYPQRLKEAWWN